MILFAVQSKWLQTQVVSMLTDEFCFQLFMIWFATTKGTASLVAGKWDVQLIQHLTAADIHVTFMFKFGCCFLSKVMEGTQIMSTCFFNALAQNVEKKTGPCICAWKLHCVSLQHPVLPAIGCLCIGCSNVWSLQCPNLPVIGYSQSIPMRDSQGRDSFTEDALLSAWD